MENGINNIPDQSTDFTESADQVSATLTLGSTSIEPLDQKRSSPQFDEEDLLVPHPELNGLFSFVMDSSIPTHFWKDGLTFYFGTHALYNKSPTNPVFELYKSKGYNGAFEINLIKSPENPNGLQVSWHSSLSLERRDFKIYRSTDSTSSGVLSSEVDYLNRVNKAISSQGSQFIAQFESVEQIIWIKRMIEVVAGAHSLGQLTLKEKTIADLFRSLNVACVGEEE